MFAYFLERLHEYSDAILSIGTSVAGGILTFTKG